MSLCDMKWELFLSHITLSILTLFFSLHFTMTIYHYIFLNRTNVAIPLLFIQTCNWLIFTYQHLINKSFSHSNYWKFHNVFFELWKQMYLFSCLFAVMLQPLFLYLDINGNIMQNIKKPETKQRKIHSI